MAKTISITCNQGSNLMRAAYLWKFPDKVGDRTFSEPVRATFAKQVRALFKALKRTSDLWADSKELLHGPRDCYRKLEESENATYKLVDFQRTTDVDLTGDARDGLYRILYLMIHPASQFALPPGMQDEIAWPIAEQIKAVRSLEEDCGISKNETVSVKYEDDAETREANAEVAK